jgi:hypothetical protein
VVNTAKVPAQSSAMMNNAGRFMVAPLTADSRYLMAAVATLLQLRRKVSVGGDYWLKLAGAAGSTYLVLSELAP